MNPSIKDVYVNFWGKPEKKFSEYELALMEGGHSIEQPKYSFLRELELPKSRWELLISHADKHELGDDLVRLVQHAYNTTPEGSFVNSIQDVVPSDWNVIDFDEDPDVDACVFYRKNRHGEAWVGHKIQGLGHDGTRASKDHAISKMQALLLHPGYWIESSDAMRATLLKVNAPVVTDEKFLQKLFNDPTLRMIDETQYQRRLSNRIITETVFGNPHLIQNINETSKNTLKDSFSKDLVKSKEWLADELAKIKTKFGNIYILGSWYANLSIILKGDITYNRLYNVDIDRTALEKGQALANELGMRDVLSLHRNANYINYDAPTLIINTSVNNIENAGWFENIPLGTLVVLQSRNNDPAGVNQCSSEDELAEQYPMSRILFKGRLRAYDSRAYQRYMVIGVR